uniref:Uncharacterized protein n=1 Tax=Oryza nivara TaxID=4536 RepID=A0A0E0GEM8_ORYNI
MGKTPKDGLLRHGCNNLRLGPGMVVEHMSHNRVEPTTMLPRNFEPTGAVPLKEGISVRGKALREAGA